MSETFDEKLQRVLQGQSPDYFIYPNAAAFAAEDLDPEAVAQALAQLHENGIVEREQVTIVSGYADGEEVTDTIGGGYRLK